MRVNIASSKDMAAALGVVNRIIDPKGSNPALRHARVHAEGQRLELYGTDLDTTCRLSMPASVVETGGLLVPVARALDVLRGESGPLGFDGTGEDDSPKAMLAIGKARWGLIGLRESLFPQLAALPGQWHPVSRKALLRILGGTLPVASTDETRYHLNGVLLESGKATSTDGHRLAQIKAPGAWPDIGRALIKRAGVAELVTLLEKSRAAVVDMAVSAGHIHFRWPESTMTVALSIKLTEATFPPYEQVIPRDVDQEVELDAEPFLAMLKRAVKMASKQTYGGRFHFKGTTLRVSTESWSETPAQKKARLKAKRPAPEASDDFAEEFDLPRAMRELTIGFNMRYLVEAIETASTERVRLGLNGELDPCRITGGDYLAVVMPMRV